MLTYNNPDPAAEKMRLAVIGSGYVGLVASACFANLGHQVTCVDCDQTKIDKLSEGIIPIYEPGLDVLVRRGLVTGDLVFDTDLAGAVTGADVAFIAVGTPDRADDGKPDLSNVMSVARDMGRAISRFCVVVIKSTVPVGTGDAVERILSQETSPELFTVASNPEFLREGKALSDFIKPDRIVVGVNSARGRDVMLKLYDPKAFAGAPVLFTARRTAELMKYAANAFLASKIAFINEMADLCERLGADVEEIAQGMGLDPRIGPQFLCAGPGFGGSCLPKDTRALMTSAKDCGASSFLLEAVERSNRHRKMGLADRIVAAVGGSVSGKTIAILGLAFKPDTDDMREAPSLVVMKQLTAAGALVRAYDPEGMENAAKITDGVEFAADPYECARHAHAIAILTDWDELRHLDLARLGESMTQRVMVDLRNAYSPNTVLAHGFAYTGIGRGTGGAKVDAQPGRHIDITPADPRLPEVISEPLMFDPTDEPAAATAV